MRRIARALAHLRGFLGDITLFGERGILVIEKYNFNLGRFLLFGLAHPRAFGAILVLGGRESTIEVSDRCNLSCEGCHYFEDGSYSARQGSSLQRYARFFEARAGEFRTLHVGGAEPALELDKVRLISQSVCNCIIYTNGVVRIPADIKSKIHVSVWGIDDEKTRGADVLAEVIQNYRGDPRAVFVVTVSGANLAGLEALVDRLVREDLQVSFNHYSPTRRLTELLSAGERTEHIRFSSAQDNLILTARQLEQSRRIIGRLLRRHPHNIIYTAELNEWIHRPEGAVDYDERGEAFCCTNRGGRPGITYRAFTADLEDKPGKCCFSDMPCEACRLYAVAWPNFLMHYTNHIGSVKEMREFTANLATYARLCRL